MGADGESEKVEASRAKVPGSKPVACNVFQLRATKSLTQYSEQSTKSRSTKASE